PEDARVISHAEACRLIETPAAALDELLARAAEVRDRGRGRTVTFSAKVFVPLTTLCRDYCGYCTFRRDPGEPGARTLTPDEVVALAQAGGRLGAKEALFSLGDKPEAVFPEHRQFLRRHGHRTTLGYLRAVCARVLAETPLLPHANPGVMSERDLSALREVNVSMGLMLETVADRLLARGMAHDRAPDKVPARRLKTIALAGKLAIPFTTGVLIGIGEAPPRGGPQRLGRHLTAHPRPHQPREAVAAHPGAPASDRGRGVRPPRASRDLSRVREAPGVRRRGPASAARRARGRPRAGEGHVGKECRS